MCSRSNKGLRVRAPRPPFASCLSFPSVREVREAKPFRGSAGKGRRGVAPSYIYVDPACASRQVVYVQEQRRPVNVQLLTEIGKVLNERLLSIDQHVLKLKQVAELRQKVRQQLEKIDDAWDKLLEEERRECELLTAERAHVESQMKSENLLGSKESLHRSATDLTAKGAKPPPSRVGNYTIMAKRLQSEIKNTEQEVMDMKTRLNVEIENKINLEMKVKELRTGLALHKRMDITNPGTPVQ